MKRLAILVPIVCVVLSSCTSTGLTSPTTSGSSGSVPRMRDYLDNGMAKVADGAIAEGARQLVAVLAERRKVAAAGGEADEIAELARTELGKIGAALRLDAAPEWLDEKNNQRTGSTRDIGNPKALQPSVILTYNMGRGRSLVAGAPIAFSFERGGGTLTASVNTNELGQATCSLGRFDGVDREQLIRAAVEYRVEGFTFRFEGVARDFAYAAPGRRAVIVALERSPTAVMQQPLVLDRVYTALKDANLDLSHYNGALAPELFLKVLAGDPAAIRALGLEKETVYLVTAMNDCTKVERNTTYNIMQASLLTTVRIIRVADGSVLYSNTIQRTKSATTESIAVTFGLQEAAAGIAEKLREALPEIRAALAGGK